MSFPRFVNTVSQSKLDNKVLWSHVKSARINYLKNNLDHHTCVENFIPNKHISSNLKHLSKLIGKESLEEEVNDEMSTDSITSGTKMFLALNSCPSNFAKLYSKAIYNNKEASHIIMATLTILKKSHDSLKNDALKIFAKIDSVLGLNHLNHWDGNQTLGRNIEFRENNSVVKGKD